MPEASQTFESFPERPLWRKLWAWSVGTIVVWIILIKLNMPVLVIAVFVIGSIVTYLFINRPFCHLCGTTFGFRKKRHLYKINNTNQIICQECVSSKSMPCPECGEVSLLRNAYESSPRKFACPECKRRAEEEYKQARLKDEQAFMDRIISNVTSSNLGYRYRDKQFDSEWINRTISKSFKQVCDDSTDTIERDDAKCFIGETSRIAVVIRGDSNDLTVHAGVVTKDGISLVGAVGVGLFLSPLLGALALAGSGGAEERQKNKVKELLETLDQAFKRYPDVV